jgi:hypothetical protein
VAIPFCNQADLELAVGGARPFVQLSDPDGNGVADPDRVEDYLEGGAAEVRSAAEVKHDPEVLANLDSDSVRRLRDANAALSARIAYTKGGKGLAMPEFVAAAADRADRYLDQLARGERRLGRVAGGTAAAINQPAKSVDFDADGSKMSVTGFKRGFR